MRNEFPKASNASAAQIVKFICDARIVVPPLIDRSVEDMYLLEEAVATVLQLLSVVLQYNKMIETLAKRTKDGDIFDPLPQQRNLLPHLRVMANLLKKGEGEIKPIHDQELTE